MGAPDPRLPLTGLTLPALSELLGSRTRALAVLRWLYAAGGTAEALPRAIPKVSGGAWARVLERCALFRPVVAERLVSPDGTVKYGLDFGGARVETVLIPAARRSTVCVSSQAGCSRRCAFCATARLGLTRSLSAAEMVEQFLLARAEAPAAAPARNVVFMGMGEPMDNLDAVLTAVEILTQPPAPQLGAGQITVSTSGVLPGMRRFLRECRANLALSLNGSFDAQREALMPHNANAPIGALLEVLREDAGRGGRLTFVEYVLFDGVNDSPADAQRVLTLLAGLPVRVNLIPYNPFEGGKLRAPGPDRVREFQSIIRRGGIRCLVRSARGQDIRAACGQLARPLTLSPSVRTVPPGWPRHP
ncbi:MAG: 23S rRNA (adenine(2503)-C(2))-methyltransferase RlmN [Myxococcaceae bacterium]